MTQSPWCHYHTFSHYSPDISCPSCLVALAQTWLITILPLYQTSTDLRSFYLETNWIFCLCHSSYSLQITQSQPNSEVISDVLDAAVAAYNCFYKPVLTLIKDWSEVCPDAQPDSEFPPKSCLYYLPWLSSAPVCLCIWVSGFRLI